MATTVNVSSSQFEYYVNGSRNDTYKNVGSVGYFKAGVRIPFTVGQEGASSLSFSIGGVSKYSQYGGDDLDYWNITTQDATYSTATSSYVGTVSYSSGYVNGNGSIILTSNGSYYLWIFNLNTTSEAYAFSSNTGATLNIVGANSKVSASNMTIGTESTISITRYDSNFTHALSYAIGSSTSYVSIASNVGTSYAWTPPKSLLSQLSSSSKTLTCTIRCITYKGSEQIGDPSTCSITLTASTKDISPTLSESHTPTEEILLSYTSISFTIGVALQYGATISSCTFKCGNTSRLFDSGVAFEIVPTTNTYSYSVTDSRGVTVTKTGELGGYAYAAPTISVTAIPPASTSGTSGTATVYIDGTFFNKTVGGVVNDITGRYSYKVSGASSIIATSEFTCSKDGNNYSAILSIGSLDYSKAYEITCVVTDAKNNSAEMTYVIVTKPMFYWDDSDIYVNNVAHFIGGVDIDTVNSTTLLATSLNNATWGKVCTVNLTEGKWIIFVSMCFASNASGIRSIGFGLSLSNATELMRMNAVSGMSTVMSQTCLLDADGGDYYLIAYCDGSSYTSLGVTYASITGFKIG